MPFKRHRDDFDLPADLELLGEQLADDALHLASRFPPPALAAEHFCPAAATAGPMARLRAFVTSRVAGLAAVACASLGIAIVYWPGERETKRTAASARANLPAEDSSAEVASAEVPSLATAAVSVEGLSSSPVNAAAKRSASASSGDGLADHEAWLRGLSGPELEGVLDLIEPPAGGTKISI